MFFLHFLLFPCLAAKVHQRGDSDRKGSQNDIDGKEKAKETYIALVVHYLRINSQQESSDEDDGDDDSVQPLAFEAVARSVQHYILSSTLAFFSPLFSPI